MSKGQFGLLAVLMCGFSLVGGMLGSVFWGGRTAEAPKSSVAEALYTKALYLMDDQGKVAAELVNKKGPSLLFHGRDGSNAILIGIDRESPEDDAKIIVTKAGGAMSFLGFQRGHAAVGVRDANDKVALLTMDSFSDTNQPAFAAEFRPGLTFYQIGKKRFAEFILENDNPRINFFDADSKVAWKAP